MDVLRRNNVNVSGRPDARTVLFAHGFGCDQHMWRFVAPAFEDDHRVVLFDHVGAGASDLGAYDRDRYGSLEGYAEDVQEICRALDLSDAIFVGHSVSAMIGVLAAVRGRSASAGSCWSAHPRATSMTAATAAASPARTSRSCWSRSTPTRRFGLRDAFRCPMGSG